MALEVFVIFLLLIASASSYYVKKHIPDHIMKTIVDPKKPHVRPKHNITKEMFVGNKYMPWRKKTEEEIPRISDHLIHEEDIEHEHLYIDPEHIKEAS